MPKKYIYNTKIKKKDLFFIEFLRKLKFALSIDKQIAIKNENPEKFELIFEEVLESL